MDSVVDSLAALYQQANRTAPLRGLRQLGWERFSSLGLPSKKSEAFRYLPLSKLYAALAQPSAARQQELAPEGILADCAHSHLVFVDGVFSPRHSLLPKEIVALPLSQALSTYGNFLQNRWGRTLPEEKNPFVALNAALHTSGLFLYLPPKTRLEMPLQCHHILTAPQLVAPRVHLFLGAGAGLDWISTWQVAGGHVGLYNGCLDVVLEQGAAFTHVQLMENLSPKGWYFESLRATQKRESRLHSTALSTGAESVRQDAHITLQGEGAEALLHGLWVLEGTLQAHTHILVEHAASACRSMQLFKGVLGGQSQSSFEGKIYVHPDAQKTEAYQLNKHLLLGERAVASSKPNLEIFADDVKASHGSTTAQIDPVELFYLKARGIAESRAKALLVQGFCQEVANLIGSAPLREAAHSLLAKVIGCAL